MTIQELDTDKKEMLYALSLMYRQYCGGSYGHHFMRAGEVALDILEDYGLATEEHGVDETKIEELEKALEDQS